MRRRSDPRLLSPGACWIAALTLWTGAPSTASENPSSIVSPSSASPITLSPETVLEVLIRPRLPLTPPPGVQQPAAHKGWVVTLKRSDAYALAPETTRMVFELPLIRLRPWNEEIYAVHARPIPWMPAGMYDLEIRGPGFQSLERRAVSIGEEATKENRHALALSVERVDDGLRIKNNSEEDIPFRFNLILPKGIAGVEVRQGEHALKPLHVAWAGVRSGHHAAQRVLVFEVNVPSAATDGPKRTQIRWSRVDGLPCSARIVSRNKAEQGNSMAQRDFELRVSNFTVRNTIWSFDDGNWGEGKRVRHQFLVNAAATVTATAFDRFGRTCDAEQNLTLSLGGSRSGCSCRAVAQGRPSFWTRVFFLLAGSTRE